MNSELRHGDPIRIHDCIWPGRPVEGEYAGRSPNNHWLIEVDGVTQLIPHQAVDLIEICPDVRLRDDEFLMTVSKAGRNAE